MWESSLRYWETKVAHEPRVRLVAKVGSALAAEQLGMTEKQLLTDIHLWRYSVDTQIFDEEQLWITSDTGDKIHLLLNYGQRKIQEAKERQQLAQKPVRICLLKARQFGGSTKEEADVFHEVIMRTGRSAIVVAHDLDSARHLRGMFDTFYGNYGLPKPPRKRESDKWWKFLHRIQGKPAYSNLVIDTAEELSGGHSRTFQHGHFSEVQLWRNAHVLMKGLLPTIGERADTTIFMEGTGSGVGDYWYDFCQMAMSPDSDWEFVFVPWYEIEKYTLKFDNEDKKHDFEAKLGDEERDLYHKGVSLEQLYWRSKAVENRYKGNLDDFRQQYPANPDEAFLTSGRPVFNQTRIRDEMRKSVLPKEVGDLIEVDNVVKFSSNPKGLWEFWEDVRKDKENLYVCGVDVAEGIAVVPELGNKGGDWSVVKVFDREKREFIARLRARIDPDQFAYEIWKGFRFFNYSILVENNPGGSGNVVIHELKGKPGIRLLKTVTLDRIHDTVKEEYGWDTNQESKRKMIDELTEQIREGRFRDPDKEFWYECSTYVRDEKGRTNAQSGKYDDCVVSVAVAFQGDKLMPMVFKEEEKKKEVIDRGMDSPKNKWLYPLTRRSIMNKNYCEF
jgi:hypothetical protein